MEAGRTLLDKLWDDHVVSMKDESTAILYIDRHLVHEVTSPQAFEGLAMAQRPVRRPDCTLVTADHNVPTTSRADYHGGTVSVESFLEDVASRTQVLTLEKNVQKFGLTYFGMKDARQGIVHVVGPEQGFTLPGATIVCGDSHTATHGAFGSLAFGIGTSEVEHVLATQTILQQKPGTMLVNINGDLAPGVTSKDLVLFLIGQIGAAGGTGKAIEFGGNTMSKLSMEARMSMSNMAIEAGARAGLVAPDEITFAYLKDRPMAPKGELWDQALKYWKSLVSDPDAKYDITIDIDAAQVPPMATWGTSPQDVVPINANVPFIDDAIDENRANAMRRALSYMGLEPGQALSQIPIDYVFIGSCTNGRIEDLRAAAQIIQSAGPNAKVANNIEAAIIVPGSGLVKLQAEQEGLDKIFIHAGFEWREPGCSMCLAMNPDKLKPQQRCASTSNRNFEGRQGSGGRTHLVSPPSAVACALKGTLADVREFMSTADMYQEEDNDQVPIASALFASFGQDTSSTPKRIINLDPLVFDDDTYNKQKNTATDDDFASKQIISIKNALAAPLDIQNVDTDMIIPKEYLKTVKRTGLGFAAFAELRYENPDDVARGVKPIEKPDFVLNRAPWAGKNAKILICGENFGCGSSREHAPWAIKDAGLKVIIAPSFADIFYNNCFKNGMLPVVLPREQIDILLNAAHNEHTLTVDLPSQTITIDQDSTSFTFDVDPFRKRCLLEGLDDIALTLEYADEIANFEDQRSQKFPWLDGACNNEQPAEIPFLKAAASIGVTTAR